jgi:hypothetical protein
MTLVEVLDREWRELVRCHRTTVRRWADRHEALAWCRSLDDVLSRARLSSDPVLGALLTELSSGNQLAARVVLQALIGRMVRMAQRDPRSSVEHYLAALWCVINNYPLSRRPVRIAANLSLETLKAVTLWPSSESLDELLQPAGIDGCSYDSLPPVDLEVRRALEAGSLLSVIDDSEAALLHSIYADGLSGDRAARRFHISEGAIRVRCSKAVRRLADHALELADAAA